MARPRPLRAAGTRRTHLQSRKLDRSLGAIDDLFAFLKGPLEAHDVGERTAFGIQLAAEELFANMVRHNTGGGGFIDCGLEIDDREIHFELVDHDVDPIDPSAWPEADVGRPVEERTPGGLGLHLVRSVVDRITYGYQDREMTVSLVKRRQG